MKNSKQYKRLQDVPHDALNEIVTLMNSYDPKFTGFSDLDEMIDCIREGYDRDKEIDSCYITYTYNLETANFKFQAIGQCYLKDQCICDEQMLSEVYITDLKQIEAEKLAIQRQKQLDKVFAKETSDAKWVDLFNQIKNSNATMDDLLTELQKYKFPNELV